MVLSRHRIHWNMWLNLMERASTWSVVLAVVFLPYSVSAQPTPHFVPDWGFQGGDISDWQTLGQTEWKADGGVISAMPDGEGGWLVLPASYQDMQFAVRFRCSGSCDAGVLLRMEDSAGGGYQGVFIELTDVFGVFRISLDEKGREVSRRHLQAAPSQIRIAPNPEGEPSQPAPSLPLHTGDWNELHVTIDANVIRSHLNGWGFPASSARTGDNAGGYGPIALYAGGSDAVQFENLSVQDYNMRRISPEVTSSNFTMQRLDEFYYAWDTAIADIDQNGVPDVVAGPYYYLGPDYTTRREIYLGETYNPSTEYALNMVTHAADFTGDGWPDVLATEMRPMVLYVNPQGKNRRWDRHEVLPGVISESTLLRDMDGDGQPEVVYALGEGTLAYAEPDPADPTAPWVVHAISEPMGRPRTIHGLGAGDVNGDGLPDVLIPGGWFEQPEEVTEDGKWPFHPFPFSSAGPIQGFGGSTMSVADLNGDGLNDVATSLNAHGWGLAWFEQVRDASGEITFEPHLIMGDLTWDNPGGVAFSELHGGVETADMDGDGLVDLVTGKRYWAHLDSSTDPDPYGEAVLYWYRAVRNPQAPGHLSFEPELIHNRSGVGSQFEVIDLNTDGAIDIVTSGDRGTFVFWGQP